MRGDWLPATWKVEIWAGVLGVASTVTVVTADASGLLWKGPKATALTASSKSHVGV